MKGRHLFLFAAGSLIGEMTSTDIRAECETVEVAGNSATSKHYVGGRRSWSASAKRFLSHAVDITQHIGQTVDVAISDSNGDIGDETHGIFYWGRAIFQNSSGEGIIHNLTHANIVLLGQGAIKKEGATGWFITADNYHFLTSDGKRFLASNQLY